jgi:predicted O-methyltransferase YrrM
MDLIENKYIQGITNILENVGERVEGNLICDINPRNFIIYENIDKIKNLQYLCQNKKKIIEIGVNACHSLLLMLIINPGAEYLLFDLKIHKYTEPAFEYIKKEFPNTKIDIIYGNSTETIKKYILDNPSHLNSYDLIHLDGGHTENIFSEDYNNSKKLITENGIIIFDDYSINDINVFINTKIKEKEIVEYRDKNIIPNKLHFIYKYL